MPSFADVVSAWRTADPKHIHPTREHESELAYWDSGKPQAEFVFDLIGEGGSVLDFGCGDGRIAIPMAKLGLKVTAVDAAPEMLERLEHQAKIQVADGINTVLSDGTTDLAKLVGPVDAINARAVFIHHSHRDVERLVMNLSKCLKPGGLLIADWPLGPHHQRIDWIDVTTWATGTREKIAAAAGLELVTEGDLGNPRKPSVWRKQ